MSRSGLWSLAREQAKDASERWQMLLVLAKLPRPTDAIGHSERSNAINDFIGVIDPCDEPSLP